MGTSTKMVFHRDIVPFHKPGNSCARNSRPPLDLDEIKPVAGVGITPQVELAPLGIPDAAHEVYGIEMRRGLHQRLVGGCDLARLGDLERLRAIGVRSPERAASRLAFIANHAQTRIGRSSTARNRAES